QGVLLLEGCTLQRQRSLTRQKHEQCDPGRRERVRCQVVLQIQDADELGLLQKGYAKDRTTMSPRKVAVIRELVGSLGIVQQHHLARPDNILNHRFREVGRRYSRLSQTDTDWVLARRGFRFDPQLLASLKDQQASLGASVLEYDDHESS